jgi:hypothetical protein
LQSVYNVRSEYIHSWKSFWDAILPDRIWLEELISTWLPNNKSLKIWLTLSLLGLERVVRNVLLNIFNRDIAGTSTELEQ